VASYLSPEWISELDEAARAHPGLAQATSSLSLVIEQVIAPAREPATDPAQPDGAGSSPATAGDEVRWHVVIDHGVVRFVSGPAASPTVRFTTDAATARAISTGATTAQGAFMRGSLRVGGDTSALLAHHDVLAGLGDVFAAVTIDD
jgi:predicted lipid carrier protein YhbT